MSPVEGKFSARGERLSRKFKRDAELSVSGRGKQNLLIQSDNLSALNLLASSHREKISCVYLDPPYNNRDRYTHYRDSLSHDKWLNMMISRLEALHPLLTNDGSIWISIDDAELHYLKVAADNIFGRKNYCATIAWQQRTTRENRSVFSNNHEYILVYAKNLRAFKKKRNLLPPSEEQLARYRNPDNDPRGPWQSVSANVQDGHATASQFYDLVAPSGKAHRPPPGRCWVYSEPRMCSEIQSGNIYFGKNGNGVPRIKRYLSGSSIGLTPDTLWLAKDVGTTDEAKKLHLKMFPEEEIFETPKPERLLARILNIATDKEDIVLDPFLGSGTTAAVAHKMERHYVGIECGQHAVTLCASRISGIIKGEANFVSGPVPWTNGGGFNFYRLPS